MARDQDSHGHPLCGQKSAPDSAQRILRANSLHHFGRHLTGGPELLDRQTEYLRTVIEAVAAERQQRLPHRESLTRLAEKVTQRYPHYRYPMFLPTLLGTELTRQAAEAAPPP